MNTIDNAMQRFVQKWIADPFQFYGVSLDSQIKTALWIVAASSGGLCLYYAWLHSWLLTAMTGIAAPVYAAAALWSGIQPSYRPVRVLCSLFMLWDCVTLLAQPSAENGCCLISIVGVVAAGYLSICTPKPPAGNSMPDAA